VAYTADRLTVSTYLRCEGKTPEGADRTVQGRRRNVRSRFTARNETSIVQ
jgi:hypothetical protein